MSQNLQFYPIKWIAKYIQIILVWSHVIIVLQNEDNAEDAITKWTSILCFGHMLIYSNKSFVVLISILLLLKHSDLIWNYHTVLQ